MLRRAYIGLGSNLGDKEANISTAVRLLRDKAGKVVSLSSLFKTAPWGFDSQNDFVNAALCLETDFSPLHLLDVTKAIEIQMGRTSKSSGGEYHDRIIDIDILMIEGIAMDTPELTLPHPLMHKRAFVLEPMMEIAPDLVIPSRGKTIAELLALLQAD